MVNVGEISEVYKCGVCGNVVEVLVSGGGELVCCNQPMELLVAKSEDVGQEKHVPVVEVEANKVKVKVGEVPHPMEEKHYITQVELLRDGKVIASAKLSPGSAPEAEFCLNDTDGIVAREYCTLHGLWQSK